MKNELTHHVQMFFQSHLPVERGLSTHTIMSYRDTIKLFLKYLSNTKRQAIQKINLADFNAQSVLKFLEDAEMKRGNIVKTRNQRLAVLKSFFNYLLNVDPTRANQYERIFHIKSKRVPYKPVEYLFKEELKTIMNEINRSSEKGRRDYALFLFLYNTGARAQEACDLRIEDLRLEKPALAILHGKGKKIRHVPLWKETVDVLNEILSDRKEAKNDFVFKNKHDKVLTRFGLRYLLNDYVKKATVKMPDLAKKKIGPHTMRHTTAMHLLQAGVDITVIKSWLGHVDLNTTHGYVEIDLKMKTEALHKIPIKNRGKNLKQVLLKEKDLINWLESFGDM